MKKSIQTGAFFAFTALACSQSATAQSDIPMTFHNGSSTSIPLVIPGVMNPNLNPMSDSGVELAVGQKVYYFPNGKQRRTALLFVVQPSWQRDTILQIDKIIGGKNKAKK